jgi:hypothetical protein
MPSATEPLAPALDEQPWYAALPTFGAGPSVRWTSAEFETELRDWVAEALGGAPRTVEPFHQRPWSTVWRVTAPDGATYWAKENCPHQAFEAHLLLLLGSTVPDRVVPVAAAELDRGRLLLPDQGPVLGEVVGDDDLEAWCRVVAEAMRLQRELAGRESELVGAGLSALHPREAPAYLDGRVTALSALPAGEPRRLADETAQRLRDLRPDVERWAATLDALGLPDTLVHNDLHAHNVFATPKGMRFFDFGDAVLGHPLTALFIPLNVLANRLRAGPDDRRLHRVADAGLEVWSDLAGAADLRAALPSALRLGRLARAESWLRVTATMTAGELADYGDAATWWLGALGDQPPVG